MVEEFDLNAVVKERQFADALGQNIEVEFDLAENFFVSQKMHFGTAIFGFAHHLHGRNFYVVLDFDRAIFDLAAMKFHRVFLAFAAHDQLQPF